MSKPASRPRIVLAGNFYMARSSLQLLKEKSEVVRIVDWDADGEMAGLSDAGVIITEYAPVTRSVLAATPGLKGVVVYGVGFDHVDLKALQERGIYLANCRGANAQAVAELSFSLMLDLMRKTCRANHMVRSGQWTSAEGADLPAWLTGRELCGKILGIVGLGQVGRRSARIGLGFGMQVLAYEPYVDAPTVQQMGVTKAECLEGLFRDADVVLLHVPLTPETKRMVNAELLALMKPTAYLINTSRGGVVDEEALIAALRDHRLAGAGLDVYGSEPISADHPLLAFDAVVATPHIGFSTEEAIEATSKMSAEEALRIASGEAPLNLVRLG